MPTEWRSTATLPTRKNTLLIPYGNGSLKASATESIARAITSAIRKAKAILPQFPDTLKKNAPYSSNSNVIIFLGDGKPSNGSTSGNNSSGIISKASTIKGSSVGAEIYTIGFGAEAAKVSNDEETVYEMKHPRTIINNINVEMNKTGIWGYDLYGIVNTGYGSYLEINEQIELATANLQELQMKIN